MRTRTLGAILVIIILLLAAIIAVLLFLLKGAPAPAPSTSTPIPSIGGAAVTPTGQLIASPSAPPTSEPTPIYLQYTVQDGDTLGAIALTYGVSVDELAAINGLANPNVLHIGQTLIIPIEVTPTPVAAPPIEASPALSPTPALPSSLPPTLTPSGPPLVEIGQTWGVGDLTTEAASVRNRGGMVSLEGWTLSDAEGNIFVFPPLTLFDEAEVRVHSTVGRNTPTDLYWNRAAAVWISGELITLRDQTGSVIDTYIVP